MNDQDNNDQQGNRFAFTPKPGLYSEKTEYLRALTMQLTPDTWAAIVARAIHDATFGKSGERAKAREWLAKLLLPERTGTALFPVDQPIHNFLSTIYDIFHRYARNSQDIEEGLAKTIGGLTTEERATLRKVLADAESEEVRKIWADPVDKPEQGSAPT
jgi:hypothetical protein